MTMKSLNNPLVYAHGVWDGLSAKAADLSGAEMLCASGFSISASLGFPDSELYTMTENLRALEVIRESSNLPIIADIDTGYGNALNAARTARKFTEAGANYVFMEDQTSPKECPVSAEFDMPLVSTEEFVGKIKAIKDEVGDRLMLVARTDAKNSDALFRAEAYAAAGADFIMPVSKTFTTIPQWKECALISGIPLVATLTPSTWIEREFTESIMKQIGVAIALLPTQALMTATAALMSSYQAARNTINEEQELTIKPMSHQAFSEFIGFPEVHRKQHKYLPARSAV